MSEYSRQYYAKNKEHLRAYQAAYALAHPDKKKAWIKSAYARSDKAKRNKSQRRIRGTSEGKLKICWANLFIRLTNPKHPSYRYYGGKGIKNFLTFDDLKTLWERDGAASMVKASIDRINSDGHYTVENCRFIEQSENSKRAQHRRKQQ